MKPEIYFSTDIESDGPIPGPHSMLSYASAAFSEDGVLLGTFTENLDLLQGAAPHPETAAWWDRQENRQAWEACRKDTQNPVSSLTRYVRWVDDLCLQHKATPVFVAYPAGFDFLFMYWYMPMFAGRSPFSFSALDMKSYAMAKLGTGFRETTKRRMPREWFSSSPHTHVAVDDAIEQGELFLNMRKHQAH